MNYTSNRWQVAIRVCISVVLLAVSVLLSSNFVSAQTESPPVPEPGTTYVVQPNDTLARIAAYAYDDGYLYEALCTYNQLEDCHQIVPGTEIVIPLLEDLNLPPTPVPTPTSTPTPTEPAPAEPAQEAGEATPTPTPEPTPGTELPDIPPELVDALYLVQEGDTLASIAAANYNNDSLAGRLCVFNEIPDCSALEPGSHIFVPEMDTLLFGEPQAYLPPGTYGEATATPMPEATPTPAEADTATSDTGTSDAEAGDAAADVTDSPVPTATPSPTATDPEPTPTLPPPTPQVPANLNLAEHLDQDPRLEIYAYALTLSTLGDLLTQAGPYTLLAPSDSAWVRAETSVIQNLLVSSEILTQALRSHIIAGDLSYEELATRDSVTSISGVVWPITTAPNGDLLVGGARISGSVSSPTNGTIHILSTLIYP